MYDVLIGVDIKKGGKEKGHFTKDGEKEKRKVQYRREGKGSKNQRNDNSVKKNKTKD